MTFLKDFARLVAKHLNAFADAPTQVAAPVAPVVLPEIVRVIVVSSMIKSVGYRAADSTLEVEFQSGAVYRYADVPGYVFDEMVESESVGKAYNRYVKDRYTFTKVED
jgi:hypothetical protein